MKDNDILVSVCITAFNVAEYLPEAIAGVMMQKTTFPFELIIGEDKGTDNSREVCLKYKEKYPDRITLVFQEQNVGIIENDISIIKKSRGKYIAWCDGDDYWIDEQKLQKQFEIMENNPEVTLVHTDWVDFLEETDWKERVHVVQSDEEKILGMSAEYIEKMLLGTSNALRHSSVMFRRELYLDSLEKDPDLFLIANVCNDIVLRVIMCWKGPFVHIPEPMVMYRLRPESSSHIQNQKKYFYYSLRNLQFYLYLIKKYKLSSYTWDKICHNMLNGLLKYSYFNSMKDDADFAVGLTTDENYRYKLRFSQKLLYWGSRSKFINLLLRPLFWVAFGIRRTSE